MRAAVGQLDAILTVESDRANGIMTAVPKSDRKDSTTWVAVSDLVTEHAWKVGSVQLESGRLDEVFRDITGGAEA